MSRIVIQNLFNREINSNAAHCKVIELIHENGIDWMHACGKKGRCTTCKIIVKSGIENLSPKTPAEEKFSSLGRLKTNERLSCQAELISGEVVVRVAEINKFPHIEYSK